MVSSLLPPGCVGSSGSCGPESVWICCSLSVLRFARASFAGLSHSKYGPFRPGNASAIYCIFCWPTRQKAPIPRAPQEEGKETACMLACWCKPVRGPNGFGLWRAHKSDELLSEARIGCLAGDGGEHGEGWVELGGNRKFGQCACAMLFLDRQVVGVVDNSKVSAWRGGHQCLGG